MIKRPLTIALLFCCASALAEENLGIPKVETLYPRGIQCGTEAELTITGQNLQSSTSLFSDTLAFESIGAPLAEAKRVTMKVKVPSNAATGLHYVRLLTNGGLSEPIPFSVGHLPECLEKDSNDKADTNATPLEAQPILLGQVVNGLVNGADTDCYRFSARKGQRITAELECFRLAIDIEDNTEVELTLLDAKGEVLAKSDDTALYLTEPFFSVLAPADGEYTMIARSVIPSVNSRKAPYRLHVGSFTRPAAVIPSGGKPGSKETVAVMDAAGVVLQKQEITWPAQSAGGFATLSVTSETAHGNPIRLLDAPNIAVENSKVSSVPVALNGVVAKPGEVDAFKIATEKGKRYLVSVHAQELGSPVDVTLQLSQGEKSDDVTENELDIFEQLFTRRKLDPRLVFTAKETGEVTLTVKDTRGEGSPLHFYRIHITEAENAVLLGFSAPEGNQRLVRSAATVPQGMSSIHWLNVRPMFGTDKLEGEFELIIENLPKGVSVDPIKFKADQRRVPVVFKATAEAPRAASQLRFRVTQGGKSFASAFHHQVGLSFINNEVARGHLFTGLAFAVVAPSPFELTAQSPEASLSKNGELLLELNLRRQPGFEKEVDVLLENPPAGFQPMPGFKFTKTESAGTFRLSGDGNIQPGKYPLVLTARTKTDDNSRTGRMYTVSNQIVVEVEDPYVKAKLPRTSLEQGKAEKVQVTLTHIRPWPAGATLGLIRLPKGVTLDKPVELPKSGETLALELKTASDALVGTYNSVAVEATFMVEGHEMKQIVGSGVIRIDPARK